MKKYHRNWNASDKTYFEVFVRHGQGRYKPTELPKMLTMLFNMNQLAAAAEIERGLNDGLLCHDAEVAWPRLGMHNKPTYKVNAVSPSMKNFVEQS